MNPRDRLQYALYLQRLHELFVIKENIAFQYPNAHYNKAAKQIDIVVDKCLENNIKAVVDGTHNLESPNLDYVISQALSSQQKMLVKTEDKYIQSAVEQNTKEFTSFIQNRIEKENHTLQNKIQEEYEKQKNKGKTEEQIKKGLREKYKDSARKRSKNIVKDALHTNQSQISWTYNLNNGMKYKVWMNGQSKSGVRSWHIKSKILPVEIDDFFDIFGPTGHAQMMYPGDLNGGAENVANCKCWLYYTNITPSNLKKKGTIQINPNVSFENENKETFSANTEAKGKSRKSNSDKSTSNSKKGEVFANIRNKLSDIGDNISNKFSSLKRKIRNKFQKDLDEGNTAMSGIFDSIPEKHPEIEYDNKNHINVSTEEFEEKINGFVKNEDIKLISSVFEMFQRDLPNDIVEFGVARTSKKHVTGFITGESTKVILPNWLEQYGKEYEIHTLIHNHPFGESPLASRKDLCTFGKCGVRYGVITNEFGTLLVKNNEIDENKKRFDDLYKCGTEIKKDMLKDFKRDVNKGKEVDFNNEKEVENLHNYIKDNNGRYLERYQKDLAQFGMEVMFI